MSGPVGSVIAASASAVAKVFVIGGIGYLSVKVPKDDPYLPKKLVGPLSRMSFNLLNVNLTYSLTGSTVSIDTLVDFWFVPVAAFFVFAISFGTATILSYFPFFKIDERTDFEVLRIVATFPNIVAFSILIFPSLCENDVVYEAFSSLDRTKSPTPIAMIEDCSDQANTMVFTYFFTWNLLFWCLGYQKLLSAAQKQQLHHNRIKGEDEEGGSENVTVSSEPSQHDSETQPDNREKTPLSWRERIEQSDFCMGVWKTISSPCFVAMFLGFVTASIPPLKNALFSPGGALRFLGAASESLGGAFPPLATIIVAASLVVDNEDKENSVSQLHSDDCVGDNDSIENSLRDNLSSSSSAKERTDLPIKTQQETTFQPSRNAKKRDGKISSSSRSHFWSRLYSFSASMNASSFRLQMWFITTRLVVTPCIVCGLLVTLDCNGVLEGVKPVAKMVVLLNSALPGALMMIVTLQTHNFSYSASVVSRVYLPSYLIAIVTVGVWSSVGIIVSIPGEKGFC